MLIPPLRSSTMKPENKSNRKTVKKKASVKSRSISSSPPRKVAKPTKKKVAKKVVKKGVDPNKGGKREADQKAKAVAIATRETPEERVLREADMLDSEGIETLLDVPGRKELPEIPKRPGRKCLLEQIVLFNPQRYHQIIAKVRHGVSLNVAVEAAGINESTFYDWAIKGREHLAEHPPIDSFFSRFYSDLRRAVAHTVADCEMTIAIKNPTKWLVHGAGRIFGGHWGKNGNKRQIPGERNGQQALPAPASPDEAFDDAFMSSLTRPLNEIEDGDVEDAEYVMRDAGVRTNSGTDIARRTNRNSSQGLARNGQTQSGSNGQALSLTPEEEFESLKVLQNIGQITMSPEMMEAFEQQIGEQSDG